MLQIPCPDINCDSLLDAIIDNRKRENREALLPFKEGIKERYKYYEEHKNELEAIHPLDLTWEPIKDELLSCYGNNVAFTEARKALIAAMPIAIQNKCPYCMLSRPNTLDHYFDKSRYPEYAVFIPNLVLCCAECNTAKGTAVFDSVGQRMFIHFYYDRMPEYQFLFFRFKNTNEDIIPEIKIELQFQRDGKQENIIFAHFHNLKLHEKYRAAINDKLSVIMQEIRNLANMKLTYEKIHAIIENRYQSMIEHYGINYWESCIYEGIINSPDFLNNVMVQV